MGREGGVGGNVEWRDEQVGKNEQFLSEDNSCLTAFKNKVTTVATYMYLYTRIYIYS